MAFPAQDDKDDEADGRVDGDGQKGAAEGTERRGDDIALVRQRSVAEGAAGAAVAGRADARVIVRGRDVLAGGREPCQRDDLSKEQEGQ